MAWAICRHSDAHPCVASLGSNWPNSQIPECICSIPHNAPFRTEMYTFLFWMEYCGIWNRCILGFVKLAYCINSKMDYPDWICMYFKEITHARNSFHKMYWVLEYKPSLQTQQICGQHVERETYQISYARLCFCWFRCREELAMVFGKRLRSITKRLWCLKK